VKRWRKLSWYLLIKSSAGMKGALLVSLTVAGARIKKASTPDTVP